MVYYQYLCIKEFPVQLSHNSFFPPQKKIPPCRTIKLSLEIYGIVLALHVSIKPVVIFFLFDMPRNKTVDGIVVTVYFSYIQNTVQLLLLLSDYLLNIYFSYCSLKWCLQTLPLWKQNLGMSLRCTAFPALVGGGFERRVWRERER